MRAEQDGTPNEGPSEASHVDGDDCNRPPSAAAMERASST